MYICQLVWKKINQEKKNHSSIQPIPILTQTKQNKKEALPPRRISKKKLKLQITARTNPLERKNRKKKLPIRTHLYL